MAADPYAAAYAKPATAPAGDPYAAAYAKPAAPEADPYAAAYTKPPTAQPKQAVGPYAPAYDPLKSVKNLGEDLNDVAHEKSAALVHDFTTVPGELGPDGKRKVTMGSAAGRVLKTGVDALDYAMGPAEAVGRSSVGRLAEDVSGMVDRASGKSPTAEQGKAVRRNVGDLAGSLTPFGEAASAAVAGSKEAKAASEVSHAAKKVFTPAQVDDEAKAAARIHRAAQGKRSAEADRTAARLAAHQKVVGNLPVEQQRNIVSAVERPGSVKLPPELQAVVDDLKKTAQHYRSQIGYVLARNGKALPSFIDDYYVHMWKEKPSVVTDRMSGFVKQGSGRNLKARSIPTLEDGIKAGLTPRFENPVDAMTAYSANMSRFLATHDIMADMKDAGLLKYYPPGAAPAGWVKLNGQMAERVGATTDRITGKPRAITMQAYAPEGTARIYNNNISKGLDQGGIGPVFRGARAIQNATSSMVLGLSGYHATATAVRGIASEVARATRQLSRGDLSGAKTLAKAPLAPVNLARSGAKFKQMVLNETALGANQKIVNAYVKSGQRLHMDEIYRSHAARTFFDSAMRGTFKRDLQDSLKAMYTGSALERAKGVTSAVGNVVGSAVAPVFEKYVPAMKQGVFYEGMQDFLRANPGATEKEQIAYATQLGDTIDNRFGEMVQDNLFWHKATWQIAQMTMLSPSWNLGTVRDIGGGVKEIPASIKAALKGKGPTDKTAYLVGLAATTALMDGAYNYLKTGKAPQGEDWLAPQTGGQNRDGSPERAIMPGEQKDVISFLYDFPHHIEPELVGKLHPTLQQAAALVRNKDFADRPVFRPDGAAPVPGEPGRPAEIAGYLAGENLPIGVKNMTQRTPGSKLSGLEALAGINRAPSYEQNAERYDANRRKYATRDWRKKVRADQKAAAQ